MWHFRENFDGPKFKNRAAACSPRIYCMDLVLAWQLSGLFYVSRLGRQPDPRTVCFRSYNHRSCRNLVCISYGLHAWLGFSSYAVMSSCERRSVDDSFNIHPDARLTNFISSDGQSDSYRTHLPTPRHSTGTENPLGPTHGAGVDPEERSELEDMSLADAPAPSIHEPLPTDDSTVIRHVDQGGRILKISSLRRPRDPVSQNWQLMAYFCSNLRTLVWEATG